MKDKRDEIQSEVDKRISSLKWIKVVGVGNVSSGKTSLIKYFCENKFTSGYQPTVGVDYGFKIHAVGGEDVRVHLWDLSGNDEYYDTRIDLYGKTDGVFIAFDVTSQASFEGASRWYDEVCKACTPLPAIFLCGCKIDQGQKRMISKEKAEDWARQQKMIYFEVSSATGENVMKMYDTLLAKIVNRR